MTMATPKRAKPKKMREPFADAPARYAAMLRGLRRFAAARVKLLEKEMAALERSARSGAATYLHRAVKELRRLEAELRRLEKKVAPAAARAKKPVMKKPVAIRAVPGEAAA
jgi:hypothetical protein